MTTNPWLTPAAANVAKAARERAAAALRGFSHILPDRLGHWAAAWRPLNEALPALLRGDAARVLAAVSRVDVLPVFLELPAEPVEAAKLERALVALWLGLAGHPAMITPLVLPGPFHQRVVDPLHPRLLELGRVRGLLATASGAAVVDREGQQPIDAFAVGTLPVVNGTVIVDESFGTPNAPKPDIVERVAGALARVRASIPGGRLERLTIGSGAAAFGEARVGNDVDAADLVASAHAAFVRAAAGKELVRVEHGALVRGHQRLGLSDALARSCGNVNALPWRADRRAATSAIHEDLDDVAALGDLTAAGSDLVATMRATAADPPAEHSRRALLVNVDNDFVYSFHFGRSIERRCIERNLRLDRICVDPSWRRDLVSELGEDIPAPIADGTEVLLKTQDDPVLNIALARLRGRRYEVVVTNVRPRLFYDLVAAGLLAAPSLVWDRHLHDGIEEERLRRGVDADHLRRLPIRVWSLQGHTGQNDFPHGLIDAGLKAGCSRPWPLDLEFFRSNAAATPGRVFAGGNSGRDWPLLVEAIRGLPLDVHLVTRDAPADLPSNTRVETRLPLRRFRDALAEASVAAIPLLPGKGASGVTVLPMAMALGVATVVTRTNWTEQFVTDGEEALLVPAGDAVAFRNAIIRLLEDAGLRARLVANARRRVAETCDLEAFTREMFATLD